MNRIHIKPLNTVPVEAGRVLVGLHREHNFGAVLLIAQDEHDGTVCFQINKPLNQTLDELAENFPSTPRLPVYLGGNKGTDEVHFFSDGAQFPWGDECGPVVWGGDYELLRQGLRNQTVNTQRVKVACGYIFFRKNALEKQIENGCWCCLEATAGDVLGRHDPFRKLLLKTGLFGALVLNAPTIPEEN